MILVQDLCDFYELRKRKSFSLLQLEKHHLDLISEKNVRSLLESAIRIGHEPQHL